MTYEGSAYFQKVWGRPQNFGNHRGGSEMLGAVVRTPVAWSTWRPGFVHPCAWALVCVTGGSRGHIAMWPLVLLKSECCYVKKHIVHVNICPVKHRFSHSCAVHEGYFVWIDLCCLSRDCMSYLSYFSQETTYHEWGFLWVSSIPVGICWDYATTASFSIVVSGYSLKSFADPKGLR